MTVWDTSRRYSHHARGAGIAAARLDVDFWSKISSRPPAEQAVAEALKTPEAANRGGLR
jgi:hypothetical protein